MPNKQSRPRTERSKIEKETPEVKRSKSGLVATWIGAIVGIAGLVFAYISLQPKPIVDTFTVSKVGLVLNSITSIREAHTLSGDVTGIISVLWKVDLTNLGEKDLSVVKYSVVDKSDNQPLGEWYTGIEQGLFSCDDYQPLTLPINIPNGSSSSVCIKLGFIMDKDVYVLVKENFPGAPTTFGEIESFLRLQSTDVFGNEITVITGSDGKHVFKYPAFEDIKEQMFLINFTSARGKAIHRLIGYQICNGLVESSIPMSCLLNDDLESFTTPVP